MNELFNVKDKVVVITGGAGILGKGIAAYLAKEGATVVVLDRSEEAGKALVDSIKAEGNEAMFLYTDVMDKEVLEGNKVEIMKAYGRIDVLLNAAGGNMAGATIAPDKTFFDLQIDAFKKVVDLNLFGTVLPTMVFAEIMVEQKKGSIVNSFNFSVTNGKGSCRMIKEMEGEKLCLLLQDLEILHFSMKEPDTM